MYPKKEVMVVDDYQFDILRFAANPDNGAKVKELDMHFLRRAAYLRPARRAEEGQLVEGVVLGGWDINVAGKQAVIIVATWAEGFGQITQWHIITDKRDEAHAIAQAVMVYNSRFQDVIWIFEMGFWKPDHQLWEAVQKSSWDDVVLDPKFKKSLQGDYRSFFKSRKTYERLNVPWKRGLILLGPPGNGKTISLKAIMHELDIPSLYVRSLTSFMPPEYALKNVFERARQEAPCLLIFEDLDSLITDQVRSSFLNEVDGLSDNDGILMIGTTNHFDRLDPGMSSRPSRFDRKYTFPNPSIEQRRDYAHFWQDKLKDADDIEFPDAFIDTFASKTDDFSFAYMKEAFISALLSLASGSEESFEDLLMEQVKNLRKEIEDGGEAAYTAGLSTSHSVMGGHEGEMRDFQRMPANGFMKLY